MTRAAARAIAVQLCFSRAANSGESALTLDEFFDKEYYGTLGGEGFDGCPSPRLREYIAGVVTGVEEHRSEIDGAIARHSRGWKLSRISKTALAVLRVAVYEMLYLEDVPPRVAINEAVEIAKGYDEPETVAFINGILGAIARETEKEPVPAGGQGHE